MLFSGAACLLAAATASVSAQPGRWSSSPSSGTLRPSPASSSTLTEYVPGIEIELLVGAGFAASGGHYVNVATLAAAGSSSGGSSTWGYRDAER